MQVIATYNIHPLLAHIRCLYGLIVGRNLKTCRKHNCHWWPQTILCTHTKDRTRAALLRGQSIPTESAEQSIVFVVLVTTTTFYSFIIIYIIILFILFVSYLFSNFITTAVCFHFQEFLWDGQIWLCSGWRLKALPYGGNHIYHASLKI